MKKIITVLLAIAMVLGAAVLPAAALDNTPEAATAATDVVAVETEPAVEEEAVTAPTEEPTPALTDEPTEEVDAPLIEVIKPDKAAVAVTGGGDYPILTDVSAVKNGNKITWMKVAGAAKYRVYLRSGSSWKKLADTTALSYTHTAARIGVEYTYTVRALNAKGAFVGTYDKGGYTFCQQAAPQITKLENTAGGVKLTLKGNWGTVGYRIYVKGGTYGDKWTLCAYSDTTAATAKIDAKNSGKKLTFAAKGCNFYGNEVTYFSAGKSITHVAAPSLKLMSVSGGQKLTVNKVKGATKYRIFVKNGSSWKKLADTASTYTNKNVKAGQRYTYTVRALNAAGKYVSGYYTKGYTLAYLAAPKITKLEYIEGGVKVTWGAVKGAERYRVFYKDTYDTAWTAVEDTAGTSVSVPVLVENEKVTLTVRCLDSSGNYTSAYDTKGKSITYYGTPDILRADNSGKGITLSLYPLDGVAKYRIFVKNGKTWQQVGDTAGTSYTYTNVTEGTSYTFTVRGMDKNGKYCTGYRADGLTVTYHTNAARTVDADKVINALTAEIYGTMEWAEDVKNRDAAIPAILAGSYQYGSNTGDITAEMIRMGKANFKQLATSLRELGLDPLSFDFAIDCEQEDGEYYFIIYLDYQG